jgi:hypothetical protein
MRILLFAISAWLSVFAASAAGSGEWKTEKLADAEFKVRLVLDPAEITEVLGSDLDMDYILVEIEVRPLYNSKVNVRRENFVLRSRRDNERSSADTPDRIAGETVLIVGEGRARTGSGIFGQETGTVIGGTPGTGTQPRRIPGQGGSFGNSGGSETTTSVKADKRETTSLLDRLIELELPMGETQVPVRGYLYFAVSAKQKQKHLELGYDGNVGEWMMPFK